MGYSFRSCLLCVYISTSESEMVLELDNVYPSLNPKMMIKEKFRISVSCQQPSCMRQKEDFRGIFYFLSYPFCLYLIFHWIYVYMNNVYISNNDKLPRKRHWSPTMSLVDMMAWCWYHYYETNLWVQAVDMVHLLTTFWPEFQIRTLEKPYQILRDHLQLYKIAILKFNHHFTFVIADRKDIDPVTSGSNSRRCNFLFKESLSSRSRTTFKSRLLLGGGGACL